MNTSKLLALAILLAVAGCASPIAIEEDPEEECVLFITLEVVRLGVTGLYWTDELDIFDNRLGLDCRRVRIVEAWFRIGDGVSWLIVTETWDCYKCPDSVVDVPNAGAARYSIALPELRAKWEAIFRLRQR